MVVIFRIKSIKLILLTAIFLFSILFIYQMLEILDESYSPNISNCHYNDKIDVVYTWVNGSDPKFIKQLNHYLNNHNISCDSSQQRFDDKYELKFSLRSLEKYAPWVNHVYIVTNGQIPYWLDLDYEKVTVVTHEEIFKDSSDLPTFSSPAIEFNLHRIPGLSKRFIYFNDDIFLGSPMYLQDFYTEGKKFLIYLAWPVPNCAANCLWMYVNDGQCDKDCYIPECQMDGNDCADVEEQKQLLYEFTKEEEEEEENEKNETIISELQESVQKLQFYQTFIKQFNTLHEKSNKKSVKGPSIKLPSNLSELVQIHNSNIISSYKLNRRHRRRDSITSNYFQRLKSRKNIDAYSSSLQHTNRVFNTKYGFHTRRVPSHAPIMIDKEIVTDLELKFDKEFQVTQRNRVRRKDDMQFSFTYYHFIMSEQRKKTIGEIFDEFDTDLSSTWSDREIRTLLTSLFELPLSYTTVNHFEELLMNCSQKEPFPEVPAPLYERYLDSKLPTISKYLIENCEYVSNILLQKFEKVPQYDFEAVHDSENKYVHFVMLNSNISDVVGNLDEIRRNRKKFVCLNDNLDESKFSENELVRAVLYDFYLSLFPQPSKFELPQELRNKFTYIKELKEWRYNRRIVSICLFSMIVVILLFTFYNSCKKKCCLIANKVLC
ncbi:N-acetylglucosamine-1-phosphotransferase subunits alpha/beta isoform X1 [Diorhabda carinulata]|uniref:N-acetylglucosamine-1-phosphotransferase subunits alpha/beta isoform X1 n=1 Tax=Diorhabda carinulata TaxID=1163345 RepID=UPI0025A1631D|nr:N-acetylglucosamine-1-phosphotransferase subunits alpha/beta isoform X1 [Diorhabda carinulata]